MATALVDDEGSPTCGICCETYEQNRLPKFLTCYHTFCTQCLASCVKDNSIQCPFCRQITTISRGVAGLTTNFYILPKISGQSNEKKRLMDSAESCRSNWAKSIIHRREAQTRLNRLHDSLRLLEGRVIRQVEENEERIAILQSLMEEPSGDGRRSVRSEDEQGETGRRLRRSQKELAEAEDLQADLTSVESFSCELSLRRLSDGSCFRLKSALDAQPLSYGNSSAQGPCVGAAMSLLTLIVRLTKEADLWEPGETVADLSLTPASAAAGSSISGSVGASASVSDTASASDSLANTGSPLLGLLSALQPSRPPDFCYLQFSVNGELRKPVVIKLMHEYAPAMCHHFVKYCDGSFRLAYQGSPVRLTNAGVSLTAGHYRDLNWTGDGMEEVVSDEEVPYLADWSPCAERRGAVRMRHRGKCADGVLVNSEFSVICDRRGVHGGDSGVTTVFAYVTDGIEVCDDISYLNPSRNDIFIEQAGVWPL